MHLPSFHPLANIRAFACTRPTIPYAIAVLLPTPLVRDGFTRFVGKSNFTYTNTELGGKNRV